jgi:hypothetical protein
MARVDEFLQLVDDPDRAALEPGNPADAALLSLLTHVAFSDGRVDDSELRFLARVLPDRDPEALRRWAIDSGSRPLDPAALARALPTPEERWKGLRFAVRMAWKDGRLVDAEKELLANIVQALQLPPTALARALSEISGKGVARIESARMKEAWRALDFDALESSEGPLESDLAEGVPEEAMPVIRIALDGVECVGLYEEGICARFVEGTGWIHWKDVVAHTRLPLGGALQLHTEDGSSFTLADFRLSGLGTLLDRLFAPAAPKKSAAPKIEQVRGE